MIVAGTLRVPSADLVWGALPSHAAHPATARGACLLLSKRTREAETTLDVVGI